MPTIPPIIAIIPPIIPMMSGSGLSSVKLGSLVKAKI